MQGKIPHVLVVDDEPVVRRLMADVLRAEALFIGRWHEGPIHLVLADPPGAEEKPFWVSILSDYRDGFDLLYVEEDGDGVRLRPEREPESIPEMWEGVRESLARTVV
jgi:CheY-like chemotaxis protein